MSGTGSQEFQTPLGGAPTTGQITVDQQRNQMLASIAKFLSVWVSGGTLSGNLEITGTLKVDKTITPDSVKGIVGTITNDNAQVGSVGEYIEAHLIQGSEISITSTVAANVTSIALSAGDWDVSGVVAFDGNASTTITQLVASINTTTATIGTEGLTSRISFAPAAAALASTVVDILVGPTRILLSTPTTVYLVARATFAVSTAAVFGQIRARRVR